MSLVLLVDDDAQFRRIITAALAKRGHAVIEAATGREAVVLLGQHKPQAVILDGLLPDGDGLVWIPRLRQVQADVPVIFVSSFYRDMSSFKRLNDELRVALIAHKPLETGAFVAQIDALLGTAAGPPANDTLADDLAIIRDEYAAGLPGIVGELTAALGRLRDTGDAAAWAEAREHAHKMRGTAGTHGLHEVSEAAAAIEDALVASRGQPAESARASWSTIDQALARLPSPGVAVQAQKPAAPSRTMPNELVIMVGGSPEQARELVTHGRAHGYTVVQVIEPRDLIERARARMPAAVLVDMTNRPHAMLSQIAGGLRTVPGAESVVIALLEPPNAMVPEAQAVHAGASLRMPANTSADMIADALGRLLQQRPQQTRVLVVDDDLMFGSLVLAVLGPRGIAARHIADPSLLFPTLEELNPDLVLLDMQLPEVTGLELCQRIRASAKWRHISVLFLTAQSAVEQRIAAFRAGADDYLVKPVVNEELLARVEVRVERAKLLRDRADRDSLTGLTLRRAFLEQLEGRLAEARRYSRPLSICLLDLDHFKKINDGYGHLVGDRVLSTTGQLLATRLRTEDVRGRWGGEELVVALPNAPAVMARQVVTRLLDELGGMPFDTDDGRTFQVTFSAGVAAFPEDGDSADKLLRVADERLYAAKRAGRARVH